MRVSFISTMAALPWGASEELWFDMASKSSLIGHEVAVSVYKWWPQNNKILSLKDIGVKLHLRKRIAYTDFKGKVKGKLIQNFIAEKQLSGFVAHTKPELLIISMGSFADLEIDPFRKFLLKLNVPYILIVHANPESHAIATLKINEVRQCCQNGDRILFVSKRLQEIAERQISYKFSKSGIIANPINMDKTGVLPIPKNETIQLALVGRLQVNIKGQALLLQILSEKKWKERNWHLNVFGEGADKQLIEELILLYQLESRVTLHGQVHDVRNDIWKENHILLMPSYYEGMPLALIEAMLSGRTAVVSDVGGASELISNSVEGFIAEGNTLNSFNRALNNAWQKQGKWKEMGKSAFTKAEVFFNKYAMENVFPDLFSK